MEFRELSYWLQAVNEYNRAAGEIVERGEQRDVVADKSGKS
jgi:hypothetical protein